MKKLFRILSIATLLVACLMVNTSCDELLDKGCGVKIVMERCSHVDGEYKPVETIGEWSFYNK